MAKRRYPGLIVTQAELEELVEQVGVARSQARGMLVTGGALQQGEAEARHELIRITLGLAQAHATLLRLAGRPQPEPIAREHAEEAD